MRIIYNEGTGTITARRLDDKRALREPRTGEKLIETLDMAFVANMKYRYVNDIIEGTAINGEINWLVRWKAATTTTEKLAILAKVLNL